MCFECLSMLIYFLLLQMATAVCFYLTTGVWLVYWPLLEKPRRVIDLTKCGFMRILSGKNKKQGFQWDSIHSFLTKLLCFNLKTWRCFNVKSYFWLNSYTVIKNLFLWQFLHSYRKVCFVVISTLWRKSLFSWRFLHPDKKVCSSSDFYTLTKKFVLVAISTP